MRRSERFQIQILIVPFDSPGDYLRFWDEWKMIRSAVCKLYEFIPANIIAGFVALCFRREDLLAFMWLFKWRFDALWKWASSLRKSC